MAELYQVEFPKDIYMNRIFENHEILAEFSKRSKQIATLPQVKRMYGGDLLFPAAYEDRPYTYCSLISSLDGRIAFMDDPVSTHIARHNFLDNIGATLNFWSLIMQRAHADASITAAKTLIAEPEGTLHVCDSELIEQRINLLGKKTKHPLNIVVSRNGDDIPYAHKIFNSLKDQDLHILIVTSPLGKARIKEKATKPVRFFEISSRTDSQCIAEFSQALQDTEALALPVLVVGTSGAEIDTRLFMWVLKQIGIEQLVIEAPRYMYHLMELGILDEFFMDFSMLFAGGTVIAGNGFSFQSLKHPHTEIINIAIHQQNFIYTRHRLVYDR
ncbi:MAG: hypothetical protein WCI30_06650 [Clostridia bacterium]